MITLGDCNGCAGCDEGGSVVCDRIAFSSSPSGPPARPGEIVGSANEGDDIGFYVMRYPSCFLYEGDPTTYETNEGHPATDVIPENQYYFDSTARAFWQNQSGVMTSVGTPSWFLNGSVSGTVKILLPSCECSAHMITGTADVPFTFADGDDTPIPVALTTACPGPPIFWGCRDQPGGVEVATLYFEDVTATGGCAVAGNSARGVVFCTHTLPNGSPGPRWEIQSYSHGGYCAPPSFGAGFLGQSHYKNLTQVIKITDGDEFHRTESDFDDNCLYLVERRKVATAYSDQTFLQLLGTYGGDLIERTDTYELRRNSILLWDFIQTYTNEYTGPQDQAQINHAAAQSASPDETYGLASFVYNDTPEYETNAVAPWDEVTTISGWGSAGSAPPYEYTFSAGVRSYGTSNPHISGLAVYETLTLDARGSYSGNPEPQRIGINITQYEYDSETGTHTPYSVSGCVDITDSIYEIEPAANEGRAEYVYCVAPHNCPLPAFVCHPGLSACP